MTRNWVQSIPTPEAYWINRVLHDTQHKPELMARFRADPETYLRDLPLSPSGKAALIANSIGALHDAGANPYLLRAHCLSLGVPEQVYLGELRKMGAGSDG
jgi:protocatechuate 4,5-dioxygenase alpha chain